MLVGFPAIKFSTATSLTQPLAHYSDDPRDVADNISVWQNEPRHEQTSI